MANQLCRHLSNSYRFFEGSNQLKYQPCCWVPFSRSIRDKNDLVNAQYEITKFVESNFERTCQECIFRERSKYRESGRSAANKVIPEDAVAGDPYILEFQINTNCNAACSICSAKFSSLWSGRTKNFSEQYKVMFDVVSFDKVRQIKFFGGEPLLGDDHLEILQHLPDPSVVEIFYSTNGSISPNNAVLDVWKKFKQIKISFSIDAINERFEYIRWPLKFKKVETNIKKFSELSNVIVFVHCTVNPINLLYVQELEQWAANIGVLVHYSPCHGEWGIVHTPNEIRECAQKILNEDHPVIKMLKEYPYSNSIGQLIKNMDQLDLDRNLNWKTVFPKTATLLI